MKRQSGITLVALIITIVVLIILAVVAVNSMQQTNIMNYTKNAVGKWDEAVENEQGKLEKYEEYLKNQGNGENAPTLTVKVGDLVYYDSNNDEEKEEWIVLTAEEGLVEIVSAKPMGSLTLGLTDESVEVTTDLDGNDEAGDTVDIAIASYNNAITTINNYCKSLVTATDNEGVRSVGASEDTAEDYSTENFNNWFKKSETVKVKAGDGFYNTDLSKMNALGIDVVDSIYWVASRTVLEYESNAYFGVRFMSTKSVPSTSSLWSVFSSGECKTRL